MAAAASEAATVPQPPLALTRGGGGEGAGGDPGEERDEEARPRDAVHGVVAQLEEGERTSVGGLGFWFCLEKTKRGFKQGERRPSARWRGAEEGGGGRRRIGESGRRWRPGGESRVFRCGPLVREWPLFNEWAYTPTRYSSVSGGPQPIRSEP